MKLLWDIGLKRRLKIYSWSLGIPIGLLLLIGLIGWIGDLIASYELNQMDLDGKRFFENFLNRGGYEKPLYNGTGEEGNAWDFYARAIETIKPMETSEGKILLEFLDGKVEDLSQVTPILLRYEEPLQNIRRGLSQTRCLIPIEYEKGEKAPLPDYMSLRSLAKLLAAHGRLAQKMGRTRDASADYLDVMMFGQDIAGGDLIMIGDMVGISILNTGWKEMREDLMTFSFQEEDLQEIANTLHNLSSTWPYLGEDLLAEIYMLPFTHETMEMKLRLSVPAGSITGQLIQNRLFFWWFFHLRSWKSLFSVHRAWLDAKKLPLELVGEVISAEKHDLHPLNLLREEWDRRTKDYWLGTTIALNPYEMAKRRLEGILKIRLCGLAALAQLEYLQNNRYPENLNTVGVQSALGGESLLTDPMTDSPWQYRVSAKGDSCEISSLYKHEHQKISTLTLGPPGR